jgi:hypothetical protein
VPQECWQEAAVRGRAVRAFPACGGRCRCPDACGCAAPAHSAMRRHAPAGR